MSTEGRFVIGAVISLIGLFGLFMAAAAHSGAFYQAGLLIFLFAVLYVMFLIKRSFDQAEQAGADRS